MFFNNRKKRDEALQQYFENAFLNNNKRIEDMEKRLEESLKVQQEENQKLLRRQAGSLEDILEELQRQETDTERAAGQLQESGRREMELVELCCLLLGQREMILHQLLAEGILAEDVRAGWQKQAQLMEHDSERLERRCTFQRIGVCGEKVDYDSHEILSVVAAEHEEQNGTVADVFSTGYYYQGHVLKKAQVAVYKYSS